MKIVNDFRMRYVTIAVSLTAIAAMLVLVLVFSDVLTPAPTPTLACLNVKGNITLTGERVYHLPYQAFYTATIINPSRGEALFCTEQDAIKAGFRKSLQ